MPSILITTNGTTGVITFKGKTYSCAIGRGGAVSVEIKREGDGATPIGIFPLRELWYRADRIVKPSSTLTTHIITMHDGWSDDATSPRYNHHITLPASEHHENLWLESPIYDLLVPIGYNDSPPIANKGSAIFLHVARPDFSPTDGCVAMKKEDLLDMLQDISAETSITIL